VKLAAQVQRTFLLRLLLQGHIAADCTTEKGQPAAVRVILERLATTHEDVLPKHDARSAVHACHQTNDVEFERHDANVLSLMTTVVNKAEIPVVKRVAGRKINPVNAVSLDDSSTSVLSSSSFCYIDVSQWTSSMCVFRMQTRWWVACPTLVSMFGR
jgi:hypothetical protein